MIINETLGQKTSECLVSIYSADIDDDCLKKAERGEYERQELVEIDPRCISKYFTQDGTKYRIKDNIKRPVHFRHADLTQELQYQNLDVIFCRNVFIYFTKPAQAQIFKHFYQALLKGGYLIVGKSEMLPDEIRDKFRCLDVKCKVFQKNDDSPLTAAQLSTSDLHLTTSA
jgi:chemotaxis protein methyltransferase CheR